MNKELFHYCSNNKCFSILDSGVIRLSDIQKSNDYKELSLFFPKIFDCLEDLYKQKHFRFKFAGKTADNLSRSNIAPAINRDSQSKVIPLEKPKDDDVIFETEDVEL